MTTHVGGGAATSSNGSSSSSNSIATAADGTGSPGVGRGCDAANRMTTVSPEPPTDDSCVEDAVDALEDGDRTIRIGLRHGRPPAQGLPAGVHRRVPVEHRQLDAERRARRAGLRPDRLAGVRRRAPLRPARPADAVLARRRAARRRLRPPPAAHHRVGPAGGALARPGRGRVGGGPVAASRWWGSSSSSAWARPCSARPTRAVLPALVGHEDLAGCHLAELRADERLARHRPDHRRRRVRRGRRVVGVRDQRAVLPARDLVAAERAAPAAGSGHQRARGACVGCCPGSRSPQDDRVVGQCLIIIFTLLAAVAPLHRPDAHAGRPEPRHRGQEHAVRPALRLLRRRRPPRRALHRHGAGRPQARARGARGPGRVRGVPGRLLAAALPRARPTPPSCWWAWRTSR